jgi:hypothetical protein
VEGRGVPVAVTVGRARPAGGAATARRPFKPS